MSAAVIPANMKSRIRKLLALANDARGNENEAQAAAAKVQDLLAEYNIEMSSLAGDASPAVADAQRERINDLSGVTEDWQFELLGVIAECNFCMYWTEGTKRDRKARLIGRAVNLATSLQVYDYLVITMDRLNPYGSKRTISRRSWLDGCTDRLARRLRAQRRSSEAASQGNRGNGQDLVLADVYSSEDDLNTDYRNGKEPGTTARERAEWKARMDAWRAERRANPTPAAVDPEPKQETEAQKRRREEKEARDNARYWERARRAQERAAAKVDQEAYGRGQDTGAKIGLDRQIDDESEPQLRVA